MMGRMFRSELLKIKRKGLWLLTVLGPFGVVAMQMVNYGLRKDYLFSQNDDRWGYYLANVSTFTPLALVLGIVILTSFTASVEEETGAWKSVAALPAPRSTLFLAKFLVPAMLLMVSSVLLALFTLAYGLTLDLGDQVPWIDLLVCSLLPYFAALPILALQYWLAVVTRHQGATVSAGVLGFLLTFNAYYLPDWLIWRWPFLVSRGDRPETMALAGLVVGAGLLALGTGHFARRDVN